jgi:hypothetical protein
MPPKSKAKGGKDSTENESKKGKNKKNANPSDELETNEPKDEITTSAPSNDITHNSVSEILKPEPEVIPQPEEVVEIKYEEPVLTAVIVEKYIDLFK